MTVLEYFKIIFVTQYNENFKGGLERTNQLIKLWL